MSTKSNEAIIRRAKIQKATRAPASEREREYLKAWEDPAFSAAAEKAGIKPELDPLPFTAPVDEDGEELDPLDLAAFQSWEKQRNDEQDPTPQHCEADPELVERRARELATEMMTACLDSMTRSRFSGLARQAETLILAISPSHSESSRQTEIAKKYNCTRAAISKDVAHMRKHKSIGLITEHAFSKPEQRAANSDRAKRVHADQKQLRTKPPVGSLAAGIAAFL